MTRQMAEIYDQHRDDDGFLYLHFCEESVFGGCEPQPTGGTADVVADEEDVVVVEVDERCRR